MGRSFFISILLMASVGLLWQCDDSTSSDPYKGEFGDKYVFMELRSDFQTTGDNGRIDIYQYTFEDDSALTLRFPPSITSVNEKFVMIYGVNISLRGSYGGTVKMTQKAEEIPHSLEMGETQNTLPLPVNMEFTDITDAGDVKFTISAVDTSTMQEVQYSVVLSEDSTYVFPVPVTFPMEFNGDSLLVNATFELENYGFQHKQNITISTN